MQQDFLQVNFHFGQQTWWLERWRVRWCRWPNTRPKRDTLCHVMQYDSTTFCFSLNPDFLAGSISITLQNLSGWGTAASDRAQDQLGTSDRYPHCGQPWSRSSPGSHCWRPATWPCQMAGWWMMDDGDDGWWVIWLCCSYIMVKIIRISIILLIAIITTVNIMMTTMTTTMLLVPTPCQCSWRCRWLPHRLRWCSPEPGSEGRTNMNVGHGNGQSLI